MNDDKEDIYKVEDDDEDIYKVDDEEEEEKKSSSGGSFNRDEFVSKLIKYGIYFFVGLIILLLIIVIFFPKGSKKSSSTTASEKKITLTNGDKYALDYSKGSYQWSSSNQSVAKVNDKGEIEAYKNGDTTITITSGSNTYIYKVHVENFDDTVVLTNVKMEKNTIELEKDKTYEMKVTFTPSNATNVDLTWHSSNEDVAIVEDGIIKGIAPGTSIITVKSTNGNVDNCVVKVIGDGTYNPVESIVMDSEDVSMNIGTSYALSYKVTPSDSINLITWESSDIEVASVENGVVYALKGGEVKITAKSGDISKNLTVKVIGAPQEEKYVLNQTEIGLKVGESYTLVPSNKSVKVAWVSSNINVASVDENGKVTAKSEGTTVITAKREDGYYVDCKVTVTKETVVEQDKISLNTNTLSMTVGEVVRLNETVSPSNNVSNVTWSSSDTNIATVNNGEVTAINAGTVTITAKIPNGAKAECVVTVSEKAVKVVQVVLNLNTITLPVNGTSQLTATIKPSNATNKEIKWSSSNSDVVSVDSNGKITAKKAGSAKIYARANNGVFDDCTVVVK